MIDIKATLGTEPPLLGKQIKVLVRAAPYALPLKFKLMPSGLNYSCQEPHSIENILA